MEDTSTASKTSQKDTLDESKGLDDTKDFEEQRKEKKSTFKIKRERSNVM